MKRNPFKLEKKIFCSFMKAKLRMMIEMATNTDKKSPNENSSGLLYVKKLNYLINFTLIAFQPFCPF